MAVEEGRLSVDVRDVRLAKVLRLVGKRADLRLAIRGDLSTAITQSFAGVPLEEGIRRLVQGHSFVLFYSPSGNRGGIPVLRRVVVIGSSAPRAHGREPGARLEATGTPGGPAEEARSRHVPGSASSRGPVGSTSEPGPSHAETGEPHARLEALQTLAQRRDESAAPELARLLAEDADPLVRSQAAAVLGIVGGDEAASALKVALTDQSGAVRLHAVRALGRVEGAEALPVLREILARDPDPRVRRVAVRWLAALPGEEARAALEAAASDRDASVRQEVAAALATWKKPIR